jgi:hypothetical protein
MLLRFQFLGFNAIPIKFPPNYFIDTNKIILKLIFKRQKTYHSQNNIEKRLILSNLKTVTSRQHGTTELILGQWNRMENPKTAPHRHSQLLN